MKKFIQILCFFVLAFMAMQGFSHDRYESNRHYQHRPEIRIVVPYGVFVPPPRYVSPRYYSYPHQKICRYVDIGGWYGPRGGYHPSLVWRCR